MATRKPSRRGKKQKQASTLLASENSQRAFGFLLFYLASLLSVNLCFRFFVGQGTGSGGAFGEFVSARLVHWFGFATVILNLLLFYGALRLWFGPREGRKKPSSRPIIQVIGLLLSASILLSSLSLPAAGGFVGGAIREGLSRFVGDMGVLTLGVCLLLPVILDRRSQEYALAFSRWMLGVFESIALYLDDFLRLCGRALGFLLRFTWRALSGGFGTALGIARGSVERFRSRQKALAEPSSPQPVKRPKRPKAVPTEQESTKPSPDKEFRVVRFEPKGAKPAQLELVPSEANKDQDEKEYLAPSTELLDAPAEGGDFAEDEDYLKELSQRIEEKLADFNVRGVVSRAHAGPVVTMFEFEPASGIKVGKIASLQDDLSMSLRASSVRIIAPIPQRGTVGIEIPNRKRAVVHLREVLESDDEPSSSALKVPLGKDIYGRPSYAAIAKMPHLLMAGATGTGKSVSINALLISLLYRCTPSELGLILIDPKILELSVYEGIPHLKVPVVTEPKRAKAVLRWAVNEMERRYRLMKKYGVRSIDGYNAVASGATLRPGKDEASVSRAGVAQQEMESLPKIVIVTDELADLMLTVGREIEDLITRLAQKARAAGIHMIVATQRPSVDVITGLIKANFPARLSFRVSSRIDSRTILDGAGAEKLLGNGDMLFVRPGSQHAERLHGAFVTDDEVARVVSYLREAGVPNYDEEILQTIEQELEADTASSAASSGGEEYDPLYDSVVEFVLQKGQASTSMIQRQFRIGYNRAARIVDVLEQEGIVGPIDGAKPRAVLVQMDPSVEDSAGEP